VRDNDDEIMRRIRLQCQAKADQEWRELEASRPRLLRIAIRGPEPDDDAFIRRICVFLAHELTMRMEDVP
jgi:hypothetical protein